MSTSVIPALINGERVAAKSGETLEALNPATGEQLGTIPRMGAEDVAAAVDAAAKAAPAWGATGPAERVALLMKLADTLEAKVPELAMIDVNDNGTPISSMGGFMAFGIDFIRYQAGLAREVQGSTIPDASNCMNVTVRRPYGVTGRIVPFNHPVIDATLKLIPALATGNTVLLKPSEHTSMSALALADIYTEIFPPGVVNILTGLGAEAGDAIVAHPEVRRIAFVGSAAGGRAIQRRAAEVGVKHVTLELGGKNPLIVFPDCDLDQAAQAAVAGMNFAWQGESCGSTSRLLVHEAIHDEFVERVAAKIDAIRIGDPTDPATETGAIVSRPQYDKIMSYIDIGKNDGRLIAGGVRPKGVPDEGLFIKPTMFDGIAPTSRIAQEEIFGPVLVAIEFSDEAEALRIANGVEYGLTAGVFTDDYHRAHRFARDLQAGYVWINTPSRLAIGTPYGGVKNSGVGKEGNLADLMSYTTETNIMFGVRD